LDGRDGAGTPPERRRGGSRATAQLGGGGRASRASRGRRQQQLLLLPFAWRRKPIRVSGLGLVQTRPIYTRTRSIKGNLAY